LFTIARGKLPGLFLEPFPRHGLKREAGLLLDKLGFFFVLLPLLSEINALR
jgi:hypothetical protein